ncbi:MAG: DUF4062 domain-containing protein [Acidaminococcaceae bacterium]|nr:DUF4062 domain-containing protein [Acidaminococcaceae bacterium]
MDKKYQIFISSTYKDLIEERNKVRDVILSMYHFPIGMEMFNAADEEQWEIIKETIDSSDYYILIIGKRYGTIIQDGPDAGISYTEKEFKYAKSVGIPVLAFIKNDTAVTSDKMDLKPEKIEKLKDFIETVKDKREVDWFSTVDELGTKVTLALYKQFGRKNRPGWIRSDKLDMEQTLNEILEQNQKIRTLEHENKELRDKIESKMPHLGINIILDGTIGAPAKEQIVEERNLDVVSGDLSEQKVIISRISDIPKKYIVNKGLLTLEDVPPEYKGIIVQDDLDEYNRKLPDDKTIQVYNDNMNLYNEVRMNGQRMNFRLFNDGSAKATDIHITLEFPKEFLVMRRSKAERLSEPQELKIPEDPITKAMRERNTRGHKQLRAIADVMNGFIALNNHFDKHYGGPYSNAAYLLSETLSKDWRVDIDGQKAHICTNSLLHTRCILADDLCVVLAKAGKFTIRAAIICEGYAKLEEKDLEIEVVDTTSFYN